MEKSESQEKVINLGKLLVKQLDLDQSVDTLGRWMAHYLAMKMCEAENAVGKEKAILEKECFDTILQIWDHRWKKNANSNPIKNFEPIFEFLTKFNPNGNDPFYYNDLRDIRKTVTNEKSRVDSWLEVARHFDKYARICVDYALANATKDLTNEEQLYWFKNSPNLTRDIDMAIIKILLDQGDTLDFDKDDKTAKENYIKRMDVEKLKYNISFLESHQKMHRKLLKDLKNKLESKST
jgi:hypothetical protein